MNLMRIKNGQNAQQEEGIFRSRPSMGAKVPEWSDTSEELEKIL
jgi:hypothetical protein